MNAIQHPGPPGLPRPRPVQQLAHTSAATFPGQQESGATSIEEPLLTSHELAIRLSLSMNQLKELRRHVVVPFIKLNRNQHRFRWSEVCVALNATREKAQFPERIFKVEPIKDLTRPRRRFRVRGTGEWKNERR